MVPRDRRRPTAPLGALVALGALVTVPAVTAAQPVDPTVLADASMPIRVVGAFVLVFVSGAALLSRSAGFVDRSVDALLGAPLRAAAYGAMAQVGVLLLGFYALSQLTGLGSIGPVLGTVGSWGLVLTFVVFAGLGFTVVGTAVTDAVGDRQDWSGLAIGATVAASVWVLPTLLASALVWTVVVAIGIGGPTRRWLHASKGGDPDAEPRV